MNRRRFSIGTFAAAVSLNFVSGCDSGLDRSVMSQKNVQPFDASRFVSLLEVLRMTYEGKGHHVSGTLRPGLTHEEIRDRCAWFPDEMPVELLTLYGWHDGQEGNARDNEHPFWIRDCMFSSLSEAEFEYVSIMNSYGMNPTDHEMLKYSFPFASYDGGWMVFPCRGHNLGQPYERPVIFVMQGVSIFFYSIELMAKTCIDWVTAATLAEGAPVLPEETEMEIWRRHNPGIFRGNGA